MPLVAATFSLDSSMRRIFFWSPKPESFWAALPVASVWVFLCYTFKTAPSSRSPAGVWSGSGRLYEKNVKLLESINSGDNFYGIYIALMLRNTLKPRAGFASSVASRVAVEPRYVAI